MHRGSLQCCVVGAPDQWHVHGLALSPAPQNPHPVHDWLLPCQAVLKRKTEEAEAAKKRLRELMEVQSKAR